MRRCGRSAGEGSGNYLAAWITAAAPCLVAAAGLLLLPAVRPGEQRA
ncbi:MAG TPA: hypothetical protein VM347_00670 [Nonomuraea sp.]|nr:hypothetical protein [Nonomuraea sp.]